MRAITRRMAIACGVGLALAAPGSAAAAPNDRALVRRLRERFERMAREDGLSGAILLARNGAPIFRAAYGQRNRAENLANRADTKFNLASIGKLFTSLAVMRYIEAGRLRLSDKLIDVWPDFPNRDVASRVTIEQLLSHTAGVPNYPVAQAQKPPQSFIALADTLALFVNDPLTQEPGAGFSYSNGGYIILGMIVERLSGEDFFSHCRRTIFAPLGMNNTDAYRADDIVPNLAIGYLRDLDRPGTWRANTFDVFRGTSAGGSYSTLDDLLAFANALSANELLSPAMTQEWTRPRLDYFRGKYGLGVSETTINGHRVIGHSGGHFGVAGELMIWPDLGYTFIALTNGEVENFWEIERAAKDALAGPDEGSQNYWFTRELITSIALDPAAGEGFHAQRGERRARESIIDVYGFRHIHEGAADAGLALLAFNVRNFPDSASALWSMAEGYRYARRRTEAVAAYRAYLAQYPDDADALRYIAQLS